jgi:VWFA-related protein
LPILSPARRFVLFTLVALGASSIAAEQQPTFRSGVRLVNVTVVAHDSAGRPVTSLTASDFQVSKTARNKRSKCVRDGHGSSGADRVSGGTGSGTGTPSLHLTAKQTRDGGGVTVVLFDRLNSSFQDQKFARDQIVKMLAKAQPRDRIALYVLESDVVNVLHDFTSDASRLIAVLNKYLGTTSIELAGSDEKAPDFERTGIASLDADTEAWINRSMDAVSEQFLRRRSELTTGALEGIANHLAGIPGRKNLVWVSAAFPFVIPQANSAPLIMDTSINRVTRAINSADVAVYPVDIRGLMPALNPTTATATTAKGGATPPPIFTTAATISPNQDTMRAIAELTGGRVYLNTNAIGEAIRRAIDDSRVSYVLGYRSSRPDNDNKFRNITVKVSRSGVELRHRKGYLALTAPARDSKERLKALERVMVSPIEASSIELAAEISRMGKEGTVVVRIDPTALSWEQKKDVREAAIDVVIAQSVADGKYFTIKETTVNLTADSERYKQMLEDGLTLSSNFTAVPGAYRLHVVVSDVGSQSVGSLIIPIK